MTYQPRYPNPIVTDALAAAEARLLAAKNKRREAKGLAPIDVATAPLEKADAGPPTLSDGTPLHALPEWGLKGTQGRLYAILVANCPLSLAQIARAMHGDNGCANTARVYISTLRTMLRPHGIVIPLVKDHTIARPYMKPPTEAQAAANTPPRQSDGTVSA